ncbi:MAG: hypothetical protein IJX30_02230 [Clostridia bacterium]|nr:hypothetical protein [Clostridia bacterium]
MADKQDMLYQALTRELDILKNDLLDEMRSSAAQVESLCESVKSENSESCELITKEIRYGYKQNETIYNGVESILKDELDAKLSAVDEKLAAIDQIEKVLSELEEIKANYKQLQEVYEGMSAILANDVSPRIDSIESKTALLDNIDKTMGEVNERLAQAYFPTEEDCKKLASSVSDNVDVHSQRILDAVAAIPTPSEVDYSRIASEVGEKLLDILNDMKAAQEPAEKIDYNRIVDDTAAKVIDAIPQPEAVDYARIEEAVKGLDVNAVAAAVAAMVAIPQPEVDYDRLADLVAEKLAAKEQVFDVVLDDAGIEKISDQVAAKVAGAATVDYDKVCRAAQAAQILPDPVDYDRISEIVDSKLAAEEGETTFDLVLDEEGIQAIAKGVAEELRSLCSACEGEPVAEAPVEEAVEEQPVEEPVVESAADTSSADDELAVAIVPGFQEIGDGKYMDAETGLVIRLKKSFTAKLKQSEEKVKEYYSALKNELVSYKKINSNVSWHGDRFNYGRDTVAKINIVGKTLGLYLALDPNDQEEFKPTVYHQKDVSAQKAYEHTPFMVKVKSDAAVKKAVRLIVALAAKLATEKEENFVETDYVAEYGYATTKQLYDEGYIKATKEKKVDLNF